MWYYPLKIASLLFGLGIDIIKNTIVVASRVAEQARELQLKLVLAKIEVDMSLEDYYAEPQG